MKADGDDYVLGCAVSFCEKSDLPPQAIKNLVEWAAAGENLSRMLGEIFVRDMEEDE